MRLTEIPWPTNSAPKPEAVLDEERVVAGGDGVHRHRGRDAVAAEHLEDPEDPDAVAVLAVRPQRDVGMGSLAVPAGEGGGDVPALRILPLHVFEGHHDAQRHRRPAGPSQPGPGGVKGQVIVVPVVGAAAEGRDYVAVVDAHRPSRAFSSAAWATAAS